MFGFYGATSVRPYRTYRGIAEAFRIDEETEREVAEARGDASRKWNVVWEDNAQVDASGASATWRIAESLTSNNPTGLITTAKQLAVLRPVIAMVQAQNYAQAHLRIWVKLAVALCLLFSTLFSQLFVMDDPMGLHVEEQDRVNYGKKDVHMWMCDRCRGMAITYSTFRRNMLIASFLVVLDVLEGVVTSKLFHKQEILARDINGIHDRDSGVGGKRNGSGAYRAFLNDYLAKMGLDRPQLSCFSIPCILVVFGSGAAWATMASLAAFDHATAQE